MSFVLAIDQGTTGSTALVFSRQGTILGRAYGELKQYYPQPGWAEHDPEEIWQLSRRVMAEVMGSGSNGVRVKGQSKSNNVRKSQPHKIPQPTAAKSVFESPACCMTALWATSFHPPKPLALAGVDPYRLLMPDRLVRKSGNTFHLHAGVFR
jgi:FGGY family of carbohydrate kinases, N-terminal domain